MKKMLMSLMWLLSFNVFAASGVEIQNPVIRFTPPGMKVTAMFLKIVNQSDKDLKIVKVAGDFAETFELHTMEMEGGKMKMRSVSAIELKKKSTTELKPGGLHIMIFDLKHELKEGESYKVKLTLDDKSEMEVKAFVSKLN